MMKHQWLTLSIDAKFQVIQDVFQTRIPEVLQWVLLFAYAVIHGGTDAEIVADGAAKVNMGQQLLMTMIPAIFQNLGAALSLTTKAAEIAGKVGRIAEIQEILDVFDDSQQQLREQQEQQGRETVDCLALSDADIVTPRGDAIATDLSFCVVPGQSLMIVGRGKIPTNLISRHPDVEFAGISGGSGKTSCVRALRGLWALPKGQRTVPSRPAGGSGSGGGGGDDGGDASSMTRLKDLVVIPQRIHFALGTLADQVTFPVFIEPSNRTPAIEARLLSLLRMVGIDYLVSRW